MAWIIATKLEMTRVIKGDKFIPVTLLKIPTLKVVGFKTLERDGYDAMIVWVVKTETELAEGKVTLNKSAFSKIEEFPLVDGDTEKYKTGDVIPASVLEGITIEIQGTSKGKGFTGAMKKHNFHGWPGSHGSKFHRALGSIGNRKPTRTHKGKKMHGHHGDIAVTIKKIPVELVNTDMSVVGIRGWVPGARNSFVRVIF
jgi:large subunit ribosomal protein L3